MFRSSRVIIVHCCLIILQDFYKISVWSILNIYYAGTYIIMQSWMHCTLYIYTTNDHIDCILVRNSMCIYNGATCYMGYLLHACNVCEEISMQDSREVTLLNTLCHKSAFTSFNNSQLVESTYM